MEQPVPLGLLQLYGSFMGISGFKMQSHSYLRHSDSIWGSISLLLMLTCYLLLPFFVRCH